MMLTKNEEGLRGKLHNNLPRLKKWIFRTGFAVADQAVFSGSNFLINIVLGRWLSPEEFGRYALGFSFLIIFFQLYVSFLLDPMAVIGQLHFHGNLKPFFVAHLKSHFLITILTSIVLSIFTLLMGPNFSFQKVTFAIGVGLPLLLLPWYFRRIFVILGTPAKSFVGSLVYGLILLILTFLFNEWKLITSQSAIFAMILASFISSLYFSIKYKIYDYKHLNEPLMVLLTRNWEIGKWLVFSGFFISFASQIQVWLAGAYFGLASSGIIRAFQVITQPVMLVITALTALVVPILTLDFSLANYPLYHRKLQLLSFSLLTVAIIFEAFLLIFNVQIVRLVYGGKFSSEAYLLPIWGIIPIILAYSSGLQAGFQAIKKPFALLIASIIWFVTSSIFGVWFSFQFGEIGLAWSAVLGYVFFALALALLYNAWVYKPFIKIHQGWA